MKFGYHKDEVCRDFAKRRWTILEIIPEIGTFIARCETGDLALFNAFGNIIGPGTGISLVKFEPDETGVRWMNVYRWREGTDSDNGGTAPTTVHWWKEDAESSARMKLRENPNLILLATKRIFWKEGDVI